MALLLWIAVPVLLVIGMLWWVNRNNPGSYRTKDFRAENQMETRRDWGPR